MLTILHYAADAFWVLAMALITSTSRGALKRVPADVKMPMWGGVRLPRNVALGVMFGAPLLIGLGLSATSSAGGLDGQGAAILFLLRVTLAGTFAVVCLTWLRGSLRTLENEGAVSA
jgi:hypothetical protein